MAEKNILAYFNSPEQAESVARKLAALRVADLSINAFSRYAGESYTNNTNPLTGHMPSLATMTQNTGLVGQSEGILVSADPAASGMSDGGQGGPTGRNILLTVVLDERNHHQALRIIEEGGGLI